MGTTKKQLGSRIKELRKARKFSQDEVAERIGIDAKYLSRIEVGGSFPSLDTFGKLAETLRVELKDFFEFAHKNENRTELTETINSLLQEATEEQLRMAVKVLRALVR